MNINIKNCEVNIIRERGTLEISGTAEPKTETRAAGIEGVISTQRTYTIAGFLANKAAVQVGDRVRLPAFTVPAVKIDGKKAMTFEELNISDEAIVIDKEKDGKPILIFSHCLFESAMDLNDTNDFSQTQLAQYLAGEFKNAMNRAGIPAEDCGLVSKEDMFGKNRLEYFKDGRNLIAFDFDDDFTRWYWLATLYDETASASYFCYVSDYGLASYDSAHDTTGYVRPRFTMKMFDGKEDK